MRIDRWKAIWSIALAGFCGGAVVSVFAGDESGGTGVQQQQAPEQPKEAPKAEAAREPVIKKTAEGCLADSATLEDLKRERRELEAKERALAVREAELKAREQALTDEIKKLAETRDEIAKIETARKQEDETKVAKLVETLESMSPKASSALIATMDETLAVAAMMRLSTPKLAKMMNVMDPSRSTKLSELLAGVTRAKRSSKSASEGAAAVTAGRSSYPAPEKGGEMNDGKSHEQQANHGNPAGTGRQPASAGAR